jgi:hypothetical protein
VEICENRQSEKNIKSKNYQQIADKMFWKQIGQKLLCESMENRNEKSNYLSIWYERTAETLNGSIVIEVLVRY